MVAKIDMKLIGVGELKGLPTAVLEFGRGAHDYGTKDLIAFLTSVADKISMKRRVLILNPPTTNAGEILEVLTIAQTLVKEGFFLIFEHTGQYRPMVAQFGGYCILHVDGATDTLADEIHYYPNLDKINMTEELPAFPGARKRYVHTPSGVDQETIARIVVATEEEWFFPDAV